MINRLISGVASSSGDNEVIAAPGAGNRIVVHEFHIVNEDASNPVTVLVRPDDETTELFRAYLTAGSDYDWVGSEGDRWALPANTSLEINLSAAVAVGYMFRYRVRPA